MLKKITSLFISISMVLSFSGAGLLPAVAYAQPTKDDVCEGVALTGGDCGGDAEGQVTSTVGTVINILSFVVGVAAVIMVIVGGFKYITSSGDPAGTNSAKNTILFAIVGLVVVALAQVIVRFVLNQVP